MDKPVSQSDLFTASWATRYQAHGFLLVQWATPGLCHCPMSNQDPAECLTKLLPKPVGSRGKPSSPSFAFLLTYKCSNSDKTPTIAAPSCSRHCLEACCSLLFLSESNPCCSSCLFLHKGWSRLVWTHSDRLKLIHVGFFQDGSARIHPWPLQNPAALWCYWLLGW